MPIPPFNKDGFLPGFTGMDRLGNPDPSVSSADMAPYAVTIREVVDRFSTTPDRIRILEGWLEYRAELRRIGFTRGFQWVDGSFVELKDPKDIDLILFLGRPNKVKSNADFQPFLTANADLFRERVTKPKYRVHPFLIDIDQPAEQMISLARYYMMLFSHRRGTFEWKGTLHVSHKLESDERHILKRLKSGVWP